MDPIRPVPPGAPCRGAGAPTAAAAAPSSPTCSSARAAATRAAFAALYDADRRAASSGSPCGWSATRPRPRRCAQEASSRSGAPPPGSTRPGAARSSWLLTLVHRKAVDRVRSAEAATRRDATYHHQQPAGRPRRHRRGRRGLAEARRVRGALAHPHRGPARGPRARLLRGLHAHRGGHDARPPGRHRQDPDPGRPDPPARRDGSRTMNERHPRAVRAPTPSTPSTTSSAPASSGTWPSAPTARPRSPSLREAAALMAETTAVEPAAALRGRVLAEISTVRPLPPEVGPEPTHRRRPAAPCAAVDVGCAPWSPRPPSWSRVGARRGRLAAVGRDTTPAPAERRRAGAADAADAEQVTRRLRRRRERHAGALAVA